ncbi:FAD-binding protein [Embleya hyalina]|uniref:Oxidoreductase n=1 Tax=Embleya hyalina TaxID=516124 RepID=A0A401YX54_9ACTN|nr:FAD-binding protein [Embleya hyalina]GCD99194.1 oxidoreductase [Embleya hyalina]
MSSLAYQLATSVLVVGAGGEGLRAAVEVAESGVAVIAVDRRTADDDHTFPTTGSFARASATVGGDPWEPGAAEASRESLSPTDPRTAQIVARYAEREFHAPGGFGTRTDHRDHGGPARRRFGDPTSLGIRSAGEYTGSQVRRALREHAKQLGVPVLSNVYVTRLLVDDGTVFGAYGFDLVDGSRYLVHADSVILATGGHTRIWKRTTSGRHENTGDAFRLAVEAGARLRNPELVRFHPFGLIGPEHAAGVLVGAAARGEGGALLNNLGERFMTRYDAERWELGTRDRIALASHMEIDQGRGTRAGGVWLDPSHLPPETIPTRLPGVYRTLPDPRTLDITHDPIEVAPTAQYSVGGVRVRPEDHGTDVIGLYAIGEAAGGPHGANRQTENSLVELLAHSRRAGRAAAAYSARLTAHYRSPAAVRAAETDVNRLLATDDDENVRALSRAVRRLTTRFAGVVRDGIGLAAGLAELDEIEERMGKAGVHVDIGGFQDLAHAYDLRSAVLAARATLECALERRESRDRHHRSDHPDPDPGPGVDLVWSPKTGVRREPAPTSPPTLPS